MSPRAVWRRPLVVCVVLLHVGRAFAHAAERAPGATPPQVSYDADRCCLLIDGQPFFAIGLYNVVPECMAECAEAGFNVVTRPGPGSMMGEHLKRLAAEQPDQVGPFLRSFADAAQQAGLWDLEDPNRFTYEPFPYTDPAFPEKHTRFLADPLPTIVAALQGHPAVLGFNSLDEPSAKLAEPLRAYHDAVRALDPQRAIMLNFWRRQREGAEQCEILTSDYYPHRGRTSLIELYEEACLSVERARELQRPYWFVPLAEAFETVPPLRPEDQVAQTYLAVAGGVSGILWWTWPPKHEASWNTLKQLAGELRALAPVLTESRKQPGVALSPPEAARSVQARVIQRNGVTFVISVNAAPCPATVSFRAPSGFSGQANVWFEGRSVAVREGCWEDRFAPHERHVYALQARWPTNDPLQLTISLPPPPEAPPGPTVVVAGNLLSDPGLEDGSGWTGRIWTNTDRDNPARRVFLDAAERHSGLQSAALEFTDVGASACWDSPRVTLQPNTLYRIGGWAKAELLGLDHRAMIFLVGAKGAVRGVRMEVDNRSGWREYRSLLSTGSEAGEVWLRCQYEAFDPFTEEAQSGSGRAWFDDLYIVPAPAGVSNMIANGGFEGAEWLRGWPEGWDNSYTLIGRPGTVGSPNQLWGLDRAEAWEGQTSLRLANPGETTALPIGAIARSSSVVQALVGATLTAGTSYTLSAYVKADRDEYRILVVPGMWACAKYVAVSDEWARISVTCSSASDVSEAYVILRTTEPGTLWIDGVQFEAGSEPTPFHVWGE